MTASGAPDYGIWIAFAGLLFTVAAGAMTFSFRLGKMSEKLEVQAEQIRKLEENESGDGSSRNKMELGLERLKTQFEIEFGHLVKAQERTQNVVEGLQRSFANLMSGKGNTPMKLERMMNTTEGDG